MHLPPVSRSEHDPDHQAALVAFESERYDITVELWDTAEHPCDELNFDIDTQLEVGARVRVKGRGMIIQVRVRVIVRVRVTVMRN